MEVPEITKILVAFDNYANIIENPCVVGDMSDENAKNLLELCRFVEASVARTLDENKAECLESHLRARWLNEQNRTTFYALSQLKIAADGMLEVYLKDSNVGSGAIDKLLHYYVRYCGVDRLNDFLCSSLENSFATNVILESLSDAGLSDITLEDEIIFEAWKNEAACGKWEQVGRCIDKMLEDDRIDKIVLYATRLETNEAVRKLIMQRLIVLASEYVPKFFVFLADLRSKILHDLLLDSDFQLYFFDGIFYFGRNMIFRDDEWRCEHEFNYELLVKILKDVTAASEELRNVVCDRLKYAKINSDSAVWIDIEKRVTMR